ncbi:hypothetical protein WG909_14130 [Peptostreptococcaceae bacterium AGR-M142]
MDSRKVDLLLRILLLPIANIEFYKKDHFEILTKYNLDITGYKDKDKEKNFESVDALYKEIYDKLYKIIKKNEKINNLDEINLYIKKYFNKQEIDELREWLSRKSYIKDPSDNLLKIFYLKHIKKLAKSFLTQRDGKISFKYFNEDNVTDEGIYNDYSTMNSKYIYCDEYDSMKGNFLGPYKGLYKALLFNSLNRFMCIDILVCSFLLSKNVTDPSYLRGFYHQISLEDIQLRKVLEKGVSENHIHISAGTNFYITWEMFMNYSKSENGGANSYYNTFKKKTNIILYKKDFDLLPYIKACSVIRVFLSLFMYKRKRLDSSDFTLCEYYMDIEQKLKDGHYNTSGILDMNEKVEEFLRLIDNFRSGKDIKESNENNRNDSDAFGFSTMNPKIIEYYSNIVKGIINYEDEQEDKDKKSYESGREYKDSYKVMMHTFYNARCYDTSEENLFIFESLKYMDNNKNDSFFYDVFFQYLRIKNEVYNLVVQQNQVKGLVNFKKYFAASTSFKERNEVDKYKVILKNQFQDKNIKKLEIRKGIPGESKEESARELRKELKSIFTAYKEILEEKIKFALDKNKEYYCDKFNTNKYYTKGRDIKYGIEEFFEENDIFDALILDDIQVPILGIVYHFIKSKDDKIHKKCWLKYASDDFKSYSDDLYFNENRYIYKSQIVALSKLRYEIKDLNKFIVGIDAASSENDTEPWVFAPVYKKARDYRVKKSMGFCEESDFFKTYSSDFHNKDNEPMQTIGFTFHAGEDFRHLISGIRRVHEAYEHLRLKSGDRIGHAIAIGIDSKKWCSNNPVVIMPRIEYLENLLWIWGLCKQKSISSLVDERYLERKIMELASYIYIRTEGMTIYDLWRAYQMKFEDVDSNKIRSKFYNNNYSIDACNEIIKYDNARNSNTINAIGSGDCLFCCETKKENSYIWSHEKLFLAYHCKIYLKRMEEMIFVEVEPFEADIINEIQTNVLSRLSKDGIVIETNPTSNSALGEIDDIFDHYIKSLDNEDFDEDDSNSLIVTINSDDPSVFQTTVSSEFAYIYYSLLNKGYPKKKILRWIDKIREHGMNTSFIKTRKLSKVLKEVKNVLNALDERKDR